eukprot:11258303-Prorocentrum_lima.AAC.1
MRVLQGTKVECPAAWSKSAKSRNTWLVPDSSKDIWCVPHQNVLNVFDFMRSGPSLPLGYWAPCSYRFGEWTGWGE